MFNNRISRYISRFAIKNHVRYYQCLSQEGVFGYKYTPPAKYEIAKEILESRRDQCNVYRWVEAYRTHGHRKANINPVQFIEGERYIPELEINRYGLDLNQKVHLEGIVNIEGSKTETIESIQKHLENCYCGNVSVEFSYIESEHEREWLQMNYEQYLTEKLSTEAKVEIAELLLKSQIWDNFLAKKFPTVKRYGGEGAESMMAFFRELFHLSANENVSNIVLGMNHRGKLNLLTTMLNVRPARIFRFFKGQPDLPEYAKCMGDISHHFHVSDDISVNGKTIHMSMLHNPSHLEIVNPVSMGKARSKQHILKSGSFKENANESPKVLNLQLHGDAAFTGQGVNQEMLMLSATPHFDVGGTIHVIINNQVGFTTPADRGRSTRYCTDLAKSIMAPVFHVNADDPEKFTLVTKLAFDYWRQFQKDVFIDFNCFRRWGHNELDDPTFTNPSLYKIIHSRKSVPDTYTERLIAENNLTEEFVNDTISKHTELLNNELNNTDSYEPEDIYFKKQWSGLGQASGDVTYWDTGLDYDILRYVGEQSVHVPKNFNIHPHLHKTHVNARLKKLTEGQKIDWATAEALAMGSLMYQGFDVRISGQDVGRGTFSHRHAMLVDKETNEICIPLNTITGENIGKLEVANSILSEEAVLGFEYGISIDNPKNLVIWEAQFGDFFNGAQIVFDTYVLSGEAKWLYSNSLVILLPHGYDGAASEHSSCRMERFLQQTDSKESSPDGDDVNFQLINPSTPAQYYHALRRQMLRNFRKPLVVVAPKILLRLSEATSNYTDFQPGTVFQMVIDDTFAVPEKVKKVILCTGKHYYNLNGERMSNDHQDTAIIRVESLCPFPVAEINEKLGKYKNANVFIWSQEEPRNMGAWSFVKTRFENMCGRKIKYYGRPEAGTPAVGFGSWHRAEAADVITGPFKL